MRPSPPETGALQDVLEAYVRLRIAGPRGQRYFSWQRCFVRILFVYSLRDGLCARRPLASLADIHIGISYLSACLKARHHTTNVVVLSSEARRRSFRMLDEAVATFQPQVVAFTAVSTQYPFIRAVAQRLKAARSSAHVVLGGVHASLAPDEAVRDGFDTVCIGEGEGPLTELADALEAGRRPSGIANLWIRQDGGAIEKNPTRDFMAELGQLPFPDRDLWQDWVMSRRHSRQVVLPSRGCPYVCTYCSNHALRKLAGGKYVRLRPVEDVLAEIRFLKQRFADTEEIYLQSETIAINARWLQDLTSGIHKFNQSLDRPVSFTCNFRVARAFLTEEVFAALQRANVQTLEIGLESGSERLRCGVLRRHYSNEDFRRAVQLARNHRMRVNIYNMLGLPGETPADYWQTVEVNRQVRPDLVMTSIFHPYPGTDLYETCKARGLLKQGRDSTAERFRAVLDLPEFPRRKIQQAFDWFDFRIYKGQRPLHYRLRRTLRNKAYSQPWAHAVFVRLLPLWHALRGKGS